MSSRKGAGIGAGAEGWAARPAAKNRQTQDVSRINIVVGSRRGLAVEYEPNGWQLDRAQEIRG